MKKNSSVTCRAKNILYKGASNTLPATNPLEKRTNRLLITLYRILFNSVIQHFKMLLTGLRNDFELFVQKGTKCLQGTLV